MRDLSLQFLMWPGVIISHHRPRLTAVCAVRASTYTSMAQFHSQYLSAHRTKNQQWVPIEPEPGDPEEWGRGAVTNLLRLYPKRYPRYRILGPGKPPDTGSAPARRGLGEGFVASGWWGYTIGPAIRFGLETRSTAGPKLKAACSYGLALIYSRLSHCLARNQR